MCGLEKKRKEKITPVHCTGMNVSPLSKCLTRRTVLLHEELCLRWEVGSCRSIKLTPILGWGDGVLFIVKFSFVEYKVC